MVNRHPDTGKLLLWFTTSTGCRATCNITKSVKRIKSKICCVFIVLSMSLCRCMIIRNSVFQSRFKIINFGRNVEVTNSLIFFYQTSTCCPGYFGAKCALCPGGYKNECSGKGKVRKCPRNTFTCSHMSCTRLTWSSV